MSDVSFYLENATDLIVVNGDLSTYPEVTFGETNTFEFYIKKPIENNQQVTTLGGTYSGTTGGTYSGTTGITLATSKTEYDTASGAYNRLKDYQRYAGFASTTQTLGGASFSESPDAFDRSPVDGIVMSIRPGDDVDEARGVWGIIENITDDTEIFGAVARISIDLFVVAELAEYDNEADVRTAFEADF